MKEHKIATPPGRDKKSYLKVKYLEIVGITDTQLNIRSLWLTGALYWIQNFTEKPTGKKQSCSKVPP